MTNENTVKGHWRKHWNPTTNQHEDVWVDEHERKDKSESENPTD